MRTTPDVSASFQTKLLEIFNASSILHKQNYLTLLIQESLTMVLDVKIKKNIFVAITVNRKITG